jgi:hypothetical protein
MPMGKGTYGSKVGRPKKKTHRDPGADARMKKFESSLRKAMAKPVKKKTTAKKKK